MQTGGAGRVDAERDFFVSYTQTDRAWAEWLAWELNAVGYTTVLQAWDMPPGTAFVHAMDQAVQHTRHILLVLSPAYLRSEMTEAEWRPGFVADSSGTQRRLLPVRVEDCKPTGLLADRVYVDLVGLDEATTRATLLGRVSKVRVSREMLRVWDEETSPTSNGPGWRRCCPRARRPAGHPLGANAS
jgi:TIR domain